MLLLAEVMNRPLDPGYAAAAEQRRVNGQMDKPGAHGRSLLAILTLVLVGVLLGTAWWQARVSDRAGTQARQQLAIEITKQESLARQIERTNVRLLQDIDAERRRQLQVEASGDVAGKTARLAVATGALPVTGPGVVVTVYDAKDAGKSDKGRVQDVDLRLVVNGLWIAGAEAIAINGQRLTATSAIRFAGEAILVAYRPLAPPYRISAIGDPRTLLTQFSDGPGARALKYVQDNYKIRSMTVAAHSLTLPASTTPGPRLAKPAETSQGDLLPSGSSSPSRSTSSSPQETP